MTIAHADSLNALIVGDGVIGRSVAEHWQAQGHACTLASRSGAKAASSHGASATPHLRLDALDAAALHAAARGRSHLFLTLGLPYRSAVWARDWPRVMRNAITAARQAGATLVFFDNVYAYGPPPLRVPMREDHPAQPATRKGRARAETLALLQQAGEREGLRWVLGRSADFYGPGVRASALYVNAMQRQLLGKRAQWAGNPDARHSFTYTPDAARALVRLALDAGAWQRAWHLPTASPALTPRQLLALSARLLGAPQGVQTLPGWLLTLLKLLAPAMREYAEMLYQNQQDYVFDSSAFMARYPDFGITPYEQGIGAMALSLRAGG